MTKLLIRLCGCAGWSAHVLLICNEVGFSQADDLRKVSKAQINLLFP